MTILTTDRLVLRHFHMQDAPEMARQLGAWDVAKWLTSPPWPYGLADAEWFIDDASSDDSFAITRDGALLGVVGGLDDLGYWLGQSHWGFGYMTEAARALVDHRFQQGLKQMHSGYVLGNEASARVLAKLGFTPTEVKTELSVPRQAKVQLQRMVLDCATWEARNV